MKAVAREFVLVFAGVVLVDDVGRFREPLFGEFQIQRVPSPIDDQLADVVAAAAAGLGLHEASEVLDRFQGGQVAGGVGVAHRPALLVEAGLGEYGGEFHLAGAGVPVGSFAGPGAGYGRGHGYARAVHADIELVRHRVGWWQRHDPVGQDRPDVFGLYGVAVVPSASAAPHPLLVNSPGQIGE